MPTRQQVQLRFLLHIHHHTIPTNAVSQIWKDSNVQRFRVASVLLSSLLFLSACASAAEVQLAPESELPAFLAASAPKVRDAYRFALANAQALETVPCYCGCGAMGHTSNLDCFLQHNGKEGGALSFDRHAAGCGICVDIAQDVKRMTAEGQGPGAIRQYVDATYGSFGPATDTPLPTS